MVRIGGRVLTIIVLAATVLAAPAKPGAAALATAGTLPPGWIETVVGSRPDRNDASTLDLQALGAYNGALVNDEIVFPIMAVGNDKSVYFYARNTIYRVAPDKSVARIAGIGVADDFVAGQPALQSPIRDVTNLSVDAAGVLTFTELKADQIRFGRIDPDGVVREGLAIARSDCPKFDLAPIEAGPCSIDDAYQGPDGSVYEILAAGAGARIGVRRPNGTHVLLAGDGTTTSAPVDGQPATTMGLRARTSFSRGPFGLAPRPGGEVSLLVGQNAFLQSGGGQVVDITTDGLLHVHAGAFGSVHLRADSLGRLYAADLVEVTAGTGTGPVRRMDTDGSVTNLGFTGGLFDFAVSPSGRYVAAVTGGIQVLEVGGATETVAGGSPSSGEIVLSQGLGTDGRQVPAYAGRPPTGAGYVPELAADRDGSVLVPDSHRPWTELTRVQPDGTTVRIGCSIGAPRIAVSVAPDGTTFCDASGQPDPGNPGPQSLHRFRLGVPTFDSVPVAVSASGPGALAAVDADHVYVLAGNEIFLASNSGGTWSTRRVAGIDTPCPSRFDSCAGHDGDDATTVALFEPRGIAVAPDGSLYIAEAAVPNPGGYDGGWVRRLTPDGKLVHFAGTGAYGLATDGQSAANANLGGPTGVAVAPDGGVVIADLFGSRVYRVGVDGTIYTIAGDSTYTGELDNGPATGPAFVAPSSVTVDTRGYVYVLDMGTGLLKRIAPGVPALLGHPAASFVPVTPTRLLDTREPGAGGPLPPGGQTTLRVAGIFAGDGQVVPQDARAVVLNVTVTDATGIGFVQVFPTGRASVGSSSNLNVERPGETIANLVTAPVGVDGTVTFFLQGGGHVIADLFGYYATTEVAVQAGRYVALTPARILDTRSGFGQTTPHKPGPSEAVRVSVAGTAGVPATGVSAVALNVTLTEATAPGFVQVIPTDGATAPGQSSNLNAEHAGQTIANFVIVPIGGDGSVTVFTQSGTHLVVDVAGYYTDATSDASLTGLFVPASPTRLLDTRQTSPAPVGGGQSVPVEATGAAGAGAGVVAGQVAAIVGNLTATEAGAPGYVQALPTNHGTFGNSSNLNIDHQGQTIANAGVFTVGAGDAVTLYTFASTHIILDISGWFTR
jgi:hypothetical protein